MKRKRINPVNLERRAKTSARAFGEDGAKGKWIRSHPCIRSGCRRLPIHACHAIARGMGSAKGDETHLVPMCWLCHRRSGEHGTSDRAAWEVLHGLTRGDPGEGLVVIASEFHARWLEGEDYGAPF